MSAASLNVQVLKTMSKGQVTGIEDFNWEGLGKNDDIYTAEQKAEVDAYIEATAKRSERDRMADVKTISGVFTGAYAEHPFTKEPIPIWIGDYVLASYGTGAVMAVPCGDQRDYDFAKHFNIPIPNIFEVGI